MWGDDDFHDDLLGLIFSKLFLDDVTSFKSVCKSWRSAAEAIAKYPSSVQQSPIQYPIRGSQWLVQKHFNKSVLHCFHPIYLRVYSVDMSESPLEVQDSVIQFSKDGWVFFFENSHSLFFLNPFTRSKICLPEIPPHLPSVAFGHAAFLSLPTSPDCLVVCFAPSYDNNYMHLYTFRPGESWKFLHYANNLPFSFSECLPILHKDMYYFLGDCGDLGVFDIHNYQWTVLSNPPQQKRFISARHYHLLECEGELVAVFIGPMGLWISICKLDESEMKWVEVTDLGDNTFFLSATTSFSRKKVMEGMENKIYLPRLHKGCIVFYSLHTQKYHTLRNDFSSSNLLDTEELLECSWMEPSA